MNDTQKAAINKAIAESEAKVTDYQGRIRQAQQSAYIYNQQLAAEQAKLAALKEGLA